MKIKFFAIFFAAVFFVSTALFGCTNKNTTYGQPISGASLTPIGDILVNPQKFDGKSVKIEGKISEECPVGGWFFLKDKTGLIYVDLHPSNFSIHQAQGRVATLEGIVKKEGFRVEVEGKGVYVK